MSVFGGRTYVSGNEHIDHVNAVRLMLNWKYLPRNNGDALEQLARLRRLAIILSVPIYAAKWTWSRLLIGSIYVSLGLCVKIG